MGLEKFPISFPIYSLLDLEKFRALPYIKALELGNFRALPLFRVKNFKNLDLFPYMYKSWNFKSSSFLLYLVLGNWKNSSLSYVYVAVKVDIIR